MNANDYTNQPSLTLGPVTLTNRTIRCGKEQCSTCANGNGHTGQWYARIPASLTANHEPIDIYLGQHWTADDIQSKVVGKLNDYAKHEVDAIIDTTLTDERIEQIADEINELARDLKANETDHREELERIRQWRIKQIKQIAATALIGTRAEAVRWNREDARCKTKITSLATERQKLTAQLKGKKARPTSPPTSTTKTKAVKSSPSRTERRK